MNAKQTVKTTKASTRKPSTRARFKRAYDKATPAQRRAIECALVMLVEGAPVELTETVAVKLADMWSESGAQKL